MNVSLVMTIIGADRPGLVGRLSAVIAEHGGNWLESRMAHLGGQFAGILRVQIPAEQEQKLLAVLQSLEAQGLSVRTQKDSTAAPPTLRAFASVEVVGHDRPGIVREISQVFAQHHVNVEELVTHVESAPMSGELLFHANATVQLSQSYTIGQLRQALERIASDLMVDIAVMPDRM
jgi:glycine cleavage system regulatory protein